MSVKVVGHVNTVRETAYVLEGGQHVTFHTARSPQGELSVFYSPLNVWASITAHKLGVRYAFLRNATKKEAAEAIKDQKLKVIGVVDL